MSCAHALDFPVEIWVQVVAPLSVPDLLSLRLVHSTLRHITDSNEVWASRVRKRWFASEDSPLLEPIDNFLEYYKLRHAKDMGVLRTLKKRPFPLQEGWRLAAMGEDIVPVLCDLKHDKSDLTTRYYADGVFEAVQHRLLVKYVQRQFEKKEGEDDGLLEDTYYEVCRLDREFDTLLPYRRETLESTISGVKNHPHYEECETSTSLVVLIISILATEIHKRVESGYADETLESFSVLRFYAGETEGTQKMQYAVIQKIASAFDIETSISSAFLIVKDETYRSGHSYISLKKNLFHTKVFSISDVYNIMRRTYPSDPMSLLEDLTRPITVRQFLISLLASRRISSLKHGWDLLPGSYMYREAYPCSKNHIQSSMSDLYALYLCAMGKCNASLSEFSYLAAKFPFHASLVDDELLTTKTLGFKLDAISSFTELDRRRITDRIKLLNPPVLSIGQVVYHAVGYYSIICGYSVTNEDTFYHLVNGIEARSSRVVLVEKKDVSMEIIDLVTNNYKVGVCFTHYDNQTGTFAPTPELKRVYPNL